MHFMSALFNHRRNEILRVLVCLGVIIDFSVILIHSFKHNLLAVHHFILFFASVVESMFQIHQHRRQNKYWRRFLQSTDVMKRDNAVLTVRLTLGQCCEKIMFRLTQMAGIVSTSCQMRRGFVATHVVGNCPKFSSRKVPAVSLLKCFRCRGPSSKISSGFPLTVSKLQSSRLQLHHHPLHHQVWTHNVTVIWHVSWKCHYGDIWHMQKVAGLNRRYLVRIPGWMWVMASTVETWCECPFIWYPTFLQDRYNHIRSRYVTVWAAFFCILFSGSHWGCLIHTTANTHKS